jgi:hypothetical protein
MFNELFASNEAEVGINNTINFFILVNKKKTSKISPFLSLAGLRMNFKLSLSFLLLYSAPSTFILYLPLANYFFKITIVTVARASN